MSLSIGSTGLSIQTFEEILEEIVVSIGAALELTPPQIQRMRTSVQNTLGQTSRVWAEFGVLDQEALLAVYDTISITAGGAALDRTAFLFGVLRRAAFNSQITGKATGTAAVVITNGTRIRYAPEGTIWAVVEGPYTIGGGGDVTITLESQDDLALTVALDPATGFDDWEILDPIVNFTAFESTTQTRTGSSIETDAAMRARLIVEGRRRPNGPTQSIDANLAAVTGNTYRRTHHNPTDVTNVDGLPARSISVVLEGGDPDDLAQAIYNAKPAGAKLYADPTNKVTVSYVDSYGDSNTIVYNTITSVAVHVRATLTTSTSEEATPIDLASLVKSTVETYAAAQFGIGDDVLPWLIGSSLNGIAGIDGVLIELSPDGATWTTVKTAISIRERSSIVQTNIVVVEV